MINIAGILFLWILLIASPSLKMQEGIKADKNKPSKTIIKYESEDSGKVTEGNLSVGKFYKFSRAAKLPDKFPLKWSDGTVLTDELLGKDNNFSNESYVGWEGAKPVEIIIDLGRIQSLQKVEINGLLSIAQHINIPDKTIITLKSKKEDSWKPYRGTLKELKSSPSKGNYQLTIEGVETPARYVKIKLTPAKNTKSELWLDEINVFGKIKNTHRSVPQNGAFHGVFPTSNGFTVEEKGSRRGMVIDLYEKLVGKKVAMVLWYQGMAPGRRFAEMNDLRLNHLSTNYNGIRHFMFGWEPKNISLKEIAQGGLDTYFTEYFNDSIDPAVLKGIDAPVFFRPMNEMNSGWVNWGNKNGIQSHTYRQAWRRMYNIAEQIGAADKHIFVWSPNFRSYPNNQENKMQNYYPGDQYVDWVGISAYPPGSHIVPENERYPAQVVNEAYNLYANYKPFMITEGAFSKTSDRLRWTKEWFELKTTHPKIKAVIWENHNDRIISLDPEALNLYRQQVKGPYWLSETSN